jgi:hypothetical protein
VKFFYYSNQQVFMAIIAAYIHLKKLPQNRIPSMEEILMIPEFDQLSSGDFGVPYFIGEISNCQIYVISFNFKISIALQTIKNILFQRGVDFSKWHFFDVSKNKNTHNMFIWVGELLSRKSIIRPLGKYIIGIGIQKSYRQIIEMVNLAKELDSPWSKEKLW